MICQKLCQTKESKSRSLKMNYLVAISLATAGPQLRVPDLSGHSRTSTASSRSQRPLPELNCDLQISVGTSGQQPRTPDRVFTCALDISLACVFHSLARFLHQKNIPCVRNGNQPTPAANCRHRYQSDHHNVSFFFANESIQPPWNKYTHRFQSSHPLEQLDLHPTPIKPTAVEQLQWYQW